MEVEYVPKNLDECFEYLDKFLQDKDYFKEYPDEEVSGAAHMTLGRWLRNKWFLWWSQEIFDSIDKEANPNYPSEKPELKKWFEDRGVNHPDDMSGIVILSYHRKINNRPIELGKQIQDINEYYKFEE